MKPGIPCKPASASWRSCPSLSPDPAWQTCLENSKRGADRLLRCIDDIRELLSTETPALDPAEEFDITLCLGETIEVLNLASGDRASRLILAIGRPARDGRQHRRAVEQVAHARSGRSLETRTQRAKRWLLPRRPTKATASRFEIIPANSNIALARRRLAEQRCGPRKLSGRPRSALRRRHAGGREAHSCAREAARNS